MKHEDGGKPCSTQLSVNMFVHRPVIHLTLNILSIRQLMVKALSAPRARPTDKLRTRRSFQLRAPGEGRHADGHGGRECLGACRVWAVPSGASVAPQQVHGRLQPSNRSPALAGQHAGEPGHWVQDCPWLPKRANPAQEAGWGETDAGWAPLRWRREATSQSPLKCLSWPFAFWHA